MQDISFVNPLINKIKEQEISIQASLSGYSFYISSAIDHKCLHFKHVAFRNIMLVDELFRKIEQLTEELAYLDKKFEQVNISYISQNTTLVPQEYFDPSQLKSLFEFNQNLGELDEIHYSFIPEINAYNVFSIPNFLSNIFYSKGQKSSFNHQTTNLIKLGYEKMMETRELPCIILGLNKTFFDMVVFDDSQLILCNSFSYTNSMDFIYFYFYTLKQLKIDEKKCKTFILGEMISEKNFIDEIGKQISHVSVPKIKKSGICQNMHDNEIARFYPLFID